MYTYIYICMYICKYDKLTRYGTCVCQYPRHTQRMLRALMKLIITNMIKCRAGTKHPLCLSWIRVYIRVLYCERAFKHSQQNKYLHTYTPHVCMHSQFKPRIYSSILDKHKLCVMPSKHSQYNTTCMYTNIHYLYLYKYTQQAHKMPHAIEILIFSEKEIPKCHPI